MPKLSEIWCAISFNALHPSKTALFSLGKLGENLVNNKPYDVHFEVSGPLAIFTRPDSGASFVSYPVPTYSSLRGMFDCVAWLKSAYIKPTKV